jgi:hypothetical protein
MDYWPIKFSHKAVLYAVLVTLGISFVFMRFLMPVGLLLAGITIILLFFYGLNYFSKKWVNLSITQFERNIFWWGMFFRFLFVLYLYLLTYTLAPGSFPFEMNAADSWTYHLTAVKLSDTSFANYYSVLLDQMETKSDFGYPVYQSLIYKLFGVYTLPVRLINCLVGSYTVLLLSRMARYLFSEKHARLTGVIAMIFPSLLWFGAIQLKETMMIFLVVSVFYHAIKMNSIHRISAKSVIIIILFSFLLFYFRTFLAVLVIMSVLAYFGLSSMRRLNFRKVFILLVVFFGCVFMINESGLFRDINQTYSEGEEGDFFSRNLQSEKDRLGNISYKEAAVAPFIIAGSFITPFPSFLNTEERQIPIIAHFQNEMIRNLMYYFAFLGLIFLLRKNFRNSSILILFSFGYLYVITAAGNSFLDRFHLPLVPFLIIAMTVGMLNSKPVWIKRWNIYLVVIIIGQVLWTIFKLNIRGI